MPLLSLSIFVFWLLCQPAMTWADATIARQMLLSRSVVKILAVSDDNSQGLGSGVVIGHNEVATNCHITRIARRIYVTKEDRIYRAGLQASIPELDTCILKTGTLTLPVAKLGDPLLSLHSKLAMFGYPLALSIRMRPGRIIHLHAFENSHVIEIDTGFTHGSSGGGVFNERGELIGLITFMTHNNRRQRFFVTPADWINRALQQSFEPIHPFTEKSFWEKGAFTPDSGRPE